MAYTPANVLFATDLGANSATVLDHAIGIARRFDAELHLVVGLEPLGDYTRGALDTYLPAETVEQVRNDRLARVREDIDRMLSEYASSHPGMRAEELLASRRVVEGPPAATILRHADSLHADLIVLGSHGHSVVGEMLIGSVAHSVTVRSRIPVLLVPITSS